MSWHTELCNVLTYRIYQSDLCPQPSDRGVDARDWLVVVPSIVTPFLGSQRMSRSAILKGMLLPKLIWLFCHRLAAKKNYVREAWAWQLRTNISSKQVVTIFMGFFVCLSQAAWRGTTAAPEAYFCCLSIHSTDACFLVTIITDHDKNSLKKLI